MKKRLISLVLALCCTAGSLPSVLAADTIQTTEPATIPSVQSAQSADASLSDEDVFSKIFANNKTALYSKYTQLTYQVPSGYNVAHGIDVSKWNYDINWTKVKNDGIDFAIIQVGKRYADTELLPGHALYQDPKFTTYMKGAIDAGIPVGVYVVSQALTRDEAIEEANFALDRIASYDIQLPIIADLEFYENGRLALSDLSKEEMTQNALAFCETIRAAGYEPMLYTSKNYFERNYDAEQLSQAAQIWLANYTQDTQYAGSYQYWQYSSEGKVDGISANTDCNFCFYQGETAPWEKPTPSINFADVSSSAWYAKAVEYVSTNNLMIGTSDTLFSPSLSLTRTMMAQILYSFAGSPSVTYSNTFSDIKDKRWYTDAVMWAAENNIMQGYGDRTFGVNDIITREQLVSVLYRFSQNNQIDVSTLDDLSSYTDASSVSGYAVTPMQWAVANKIVSGRTAATLAPRGTTTRAECAQILMEYLTGIAASLMEKSE